MSTTAPNERYNERANDEHPLCEVIRHDLHCRYFGRRSGQRPGQLTQVAFQRANSALHPVPEAQTIRAPVPLSVAIATTMKQLREECPELLTDAELSPALSEKHADPQD